MKLLKGKSNQPRNLKKIFFFESFIAVKHLKGKISWHIKSDSHEVKKRKIISYHCLIKRSLKFLKLILE